MFSDPERNVTMLELEPEMTVADFGTGSGFYALAAARHVQRGKVYAIDVQKELLERVKNAARQSHLSNIEVLWGDIEKQGGSKLKDHSVDAAIVSNILFQVEDKKGLIGEVRRVLKPKGKILLVDWADSFGGMGPQPQDVIPALVAEKLFTDNGFILERQIPAGEHHYGLVLRKKE